MKKKYVIQPKTARISIAWHPTLCSYWSVSLLTLLTLGAAIVRAAEPLAWDPMRLKATPASSPPTITLDYAYETTGLPSGMTISHEVHRRTMGSKPWELRYSGANSSFVDSADPIKIYEYRVTRHLSQAVGTVKKVEGFASASIRGYWTGHRGKVILLVDQRYIGQIDTDLAIFEQDLVGDGWAVIRHVLPAVISGWPNNSWSDQEAWAAEKTWAAENKQRVNEAKAIIKADYDAFPTMVKAVIIIGRVAVPYSGHSADDGHEGCGLEEGIGGGILDLLNGPGGSHAGAWTTDAYYGEMSSPFGADATSTWSDTLHVATCVGRYQSTNVPNDGKFDSDVLPSALELMVGRIDFSRLPLQNSIGDEFELTRKYLRKNHQYRLSTKTYSQKALIGHFERSGIFNPMETEAQNTFGHGQFTSWTSVQSTWGWSTATEQSQNGYIASFFWGKGGNHQVSWATTIEDYPLANPKVPFSFFHASYSGDWDWENNILRGILTAPDHTLATMWWSAPRIHALSAGAPFGQTMLTLHSTDQAFMAPANVSVLGDPTLRLQTVPPVSAVTVVRNAYGQATSITWSAPTPLPPGFAGYRVLRGLSHNSPFAVIRYTTSQSAAFTFEPANCVYMVQALVEQGFNDGNKYTNYSVGMLSPQLAAKPYIVAQPANRVSTLGRAIAFTVHVDSSSPVAFQWYKDNVAIPNATSPELLISEVQSSDVATYKVKLDNVTGTTWSQNATLTLNQKPTVTSPIINVAEETPATITPQITDQDGPLAVTLLSFSQPSKGFVTESGGSFVYTSIAGFYGPDTFTVTYGDGLEATTFAVPIDIIDQSGGVHSLPGLTAFDRNPAYPGQSRVLSDGKWEVQNDPFYDMSNERFEHKSITGDFEAVVRVHSYRSSDLGLTFWTGLGIREVPDALSGKATMIGFQSSGTVTAHYPFYDSTFNPVILGITFPDSWLGIQRRGNHLFWFVSNDGLLWKTAGSPFTWENMPATLYVGLTVTGQKFSEDGIGDLNGRAVFSDFSLEPGVSSRFFQGLEVSVDPDSPSSPELLITGGPDGATIQVDKSDDLQTWSPLVSVVSSSSGIQYTDTGSATAIKMFYRASVGSARSITAAGFYRPALVNGYNFIGKQLNSTSTDISDFIKAAPNNLSLKKFDLAQQVWVDASTYAPATGWNSPVTVTLGEGVLIQNLGSSFTAFITGTVAPMNSVTLHPNKYTAVSWPAPMSVSLDGVGLPDQDGDAILLFDELNQQYHDAIGYFDEIGWLPQPANVQVGEGFFYFNSSSTPRTWSRTFTVW
jgi:hypothetical protein